MTTKILNILQIASLKLDVTPLQIQNTLALAPVYTLVLFWSLGLLAFFITNGFSSMSELFGIFLAYSIGVLLSYFLIAYVFIYALQRALLKYNHLNLYWILASAIVLTLFFSGVIFFITVLNIGLRGFNLGVIAFIACFALPFAVMYWILLFRQHQKNESINRQNI
jgi:FlaA1/EpsC-like NDP-sugar epimerase